MVESDHDSFMHRCFELAKRGGKYVKSNPQVGAVIVYNGEIIGEGWHQNFGKAHAEINAINSVSPNSKHLLKDASIYVSLEPCNSTGKTGPCSDAILKAGINQVIVSCLDPTIKGKSLEYLQSKGVEIQSGICESEGQELLKPFVANHLEKRPYTILKYAQSSDFYMGRTDQQVWLSNTFTKVLTHKWRSECDGILIGVNTLNTDNPKLTTREYPGENPRPIIIDPNYRGNLDSYLYSNSAEKPIVVTKVPTNNQQLADCIFDIEKQELSELMTILYSEFDISRLMIEGGATTLSHFIKNGLWDECRQITSNKQLEKGLKAPFLQGHRGKSINLDSDKIQYIYNRG